MERPLSDAPRLERRASPPPGGRTGGPSLRPRPADLWVVASLALTLGGTGLAAAWAEPGALGVTAITVLLLLFLAWLVTGSPRLGWLLLFGLVVGVLELISDWVHVVHLGSLVYTDYFGFRLLASPSYMPVGWWLTAVQFGYLAVRVSEVGGRVVGLGAVTILGMTIPPWYEEFAAAAKAWHYTGSGPVLSHTPVWVILTYGGCMLAIGAAALTYRRRGWGRALGAGVAASAGIFVSGVVGYGLLG